MEANVQKCIYIRSEAERNNVAHNTEEKTGKRDEFFKENQKEEVTVENILSRMGLVLGEAEVSLQYMQASMQNNRSQKEIELMIRKEIAKGKDITCWTKGEDKKRQRRE